MSQTATAPLGEQIRMKQGAAAAAVSLRTMVTTTPSAREQRKGGNGKTPVAPKGFRFTAPTLIRPILAVQDESVRRQAMESLEQFRAEVGPFMQDLAAGIRRIESFGDDERAMASGDWDAIQSALAEQLNAPDPLAKLLATIAYASAMVNTCPEGRGWVIATLKDLVEKGFLVDAPKPAETAGPFRPKPGQVYAYSRLYELTEMFRKNDEAQDVLSSISALVSRAVAAGREYYEARRDEVIALAGPPETQLSLDQLQSPTCPNGFRHLSVPEQEWVDRRDSSPRFRKAGGVVVQVVRNEKGAAITMVAGYGGAERDAEKIREANVFISPSSLRSERVQLSRQVEPAQFWAISQLHRLVRLGIDEAAEQAKRESAKANFNAACRAERDALTAKATLTPDEKLVGEGVGSAVIHWAPGAFEWRKFDPATKKTTIVRVWHLFALMERDEQGKIRVTECPPRLVEFFAGHRDYESAGQEYSELGKFGIILRRAKANIAKAAEAERAAMGKNADGASADASEIAASE